jgi:two-component system, OmpR family, response regulator
VSASIAGRRTPQKRHHNKPMQTVLVVDDEPVVRDVVVRYLERDGFRTLTASNGDTARELIEQREPSLVVLDVMLPGTDGLTLCRWIRGRSSLPVILLTARGEEADRIVGLELGADDYIPKPVHPRELAARLRAVLRRQQPEATGGVREVAVGPLRLAPASRQSWLSDQELGLTVSEFDLLLLLARRPGDVLTKDELFERALRRPREPYDRSVDVHVSNLRQKLAAAGGGVEIETARALGYRLTTGG